MKSAETISQNKGKAAVSLTLSNDVIEIINNTANKSATVNKIIKQRYQTEEGLNQEINYYKEKIEVLKKKIKNFRAEKNDYLKNVPEGLKKECKKYTDSEGAEQEGLKKLLRRLNPDKVCLWVEIINKRYNKTYTPDQLKKIAGRYG